MKKIYCLSIFLASLILIQPSFSDTSHKEPEGFRGIKWGTDINDVGFECKDIRKTPKIIKQCKIKNEMIGADMNIDNITYFFFKNAFYQVYLSSTDVTFNVLAKKTLEYKYGFPSFVYSNGDRLIWNFKNVEILYFFSKKREKTKITYRYKPIYLKWLKELGIFDKL